MSSTRRRSVARRSALVALVASLAVVGSTTPGFSVSQEGSLAPFAKLTQSYWSEAMSITNRYFTSLLRRRS